MAVEQFQVEDLKRMFPGHSEEVYFNMFWGLVHLSQSIIGIADEKTPPNKGIIKNLPRILSEISLAVVMYPENPNIELFIKKGIIDEG